MDDSHGPKRRSSIGSWAKPLVFIVIIIAILAYLAATWHGVSTISGNQTLSLQNNQSAYFLLKSGGDKYAIYLKNLSSGYAEFYVSETPIPTNPVDEFALSNGESVNISTNGTSNANLHIRLVKSTNSSATVELTPIPSIFSAKVSPGVAVRNPYSLYSSSNQTIVITPPPSPPPKTTNTTTKNSTTTKTTQNTTKTVAPTPYENISNILNTTYMGTLMNNYKALYQKDSQCTVSVYNTTFLVYENQISGVPAASQPVGPFDYANASQGVPTNININVSQSSKTLYMVNYTAITPSKSLTGIVVSMNLNSSTGVLTNVKFEGLYLGQNYTTLKSTYTFQNNINTDCGTYIP